MERWCLHGTTILSFMTKLSDRMNKIADQYYVISQSRWKFYIFFIIMLATQNKALDQGTNYVLSIEVFFPAHSYLKRINLRCGLVWDKLQDYGWIDDSSHDIITVGHVCWFQSQQCNNTCLFSWFTRTYVNNNALRNLNANNWW